MSTPRPAAAALSLALAGALALQGIAAAQPAPAKPADAPLSDLEARREQARLRFEKGVALFEKEQWAAALAEFLRSREIFPTRSATKNAAVALQQLGRVDEALTLFEVLLRDFPEMSAADKLDAQKTVAELRDRVGTVDVGGAEPGATIFVDGLPRADYPPIAPLRVPAGTHILRVFKEGFEPFEARVDVAGGQTVRVKAPLRALTASGRLRVVERSGKTVDVVVDGAIVGQTPWEGELGVGAHTVALTSSGDLGTQPALAPVKRQELTAITLDAIPLEAAAQIDVVPAGASVAVDGVTVGRGTWIGRLQTGPHRIEVTAEGFLARAQTVSLARGERRALKIELTRDLDAPMWRKPSKLVVDASLAFALAPSLAGDLSSTCTGACSAGPALGLLATATGTYELGTGLGIGLSAGYLLAAQSIDDRPTELRPRGLAARPGVVEDSLRLSGFLVGLAGSLRTGDRFPALFRLGAGALLGSVRDVRSGTFETSGGVTYAAPDLGDAPPARYFYLAPEARIGFRPADRLELTAGLEVLVAIALSQPRWGQDRDDLSLALPDDGISTYPDETLAGSVFLVVAPGIGARYEF